MWWNTGPHLRRRLQGGVFIKHLERQHLDDKASKALFKCSSDVEELLVILRSKFGSVTRAWLLALDTDQNGCLEFREFCSALRALGYVGNLRTMWYHLDKDGSGIITLGELEPRPAAILEKFRYLSCKQCGTIDNLWHSVLDLDHSGTVSLTEFAAHIGVLGYTNEEEIEELFNLLLLRIGSNYITLDDISFLQTWEEEKKAAMYRKRMAKSWVNKDPFLREEVIMPGMHDDPGDYANMCSANEDKDKDDFKRFLVDRYGSLAKAFDTVDANGNGCLSMVEFQAVVSTVLRYCRPADARRLFLSFKEDPGAMLTWSELGISSTEWSQYLLDKKGKQQQRAAGRLSSRLDPLEPTWRQKKAAETHLTRLRESTPRCDVAFGMPLPLDWGFPPTFDPAHRVHPAHPGSLSARRAKAAAASVTQRPFTPRPCTPRPFTPR
mmetsp:Transcript_22132/g.48937  ORF Transcript_22132/g.48937 Transcript_22132/m.48937 type:complete len:437 (-) Transcript_22132:322-1632(-)